MEREFHPTGSTADFLRWHGAGGDVTASVVAAVLGCHPYLSREHLADRLLGLSDSGTDLPPGNASMRRGRRFESAVAAAAAEDHPDWQVEKATEYVRIPELRLGSTPDYFLRDSVNRRGVLQIKTVAQHQFVEKWHGQPPLAYYLQTLTEAFVTERDFGVLAVMVMGGEYPVYYYNVPRHEDAERRLLAAVRQFWTDLDTGRLGAAPSIEGLAEIFDDGSVVDLSADNELPGLLEERARLVQQRGVTYKRLDEIDAEIKRKIGSAARAHLPGWAISYGMHHRNAVTIAAKDIRTLRVRRSKDELEEEFA